MNKQLLLISISTFIAVVAWITFDIMHAQPNVPVNPKINSVLEPVEPVFNEKTLQFIAEVNPAPDLNAPSAAVETALVTSTISATPADLLPTAALSSPSPSVIPSASPTPSRTPSPSPSPSPNISNPTATPGAGLTSPLPSN